MPPREIPADVRAAILALMADEITPKLNAARAEAGSPLMEGDRRGVALVGADGQPVRVGTIAKTKAGQAVTIDDAAALEWVREHAPTEIVENIRPHYRAELVKQIQTYGGPLHRGEIVKVPWATVDTRPGTARVDRPGDPDSAERAAAFDAIRAAMARGELDLGGLVRGELGSGEPGQ